MCIYICTYTHAHIYMQIYIYNFAKVLLTVCTAIHANIHIYFLHNFTKVLFRLFVIGKPTCKLNYVEIIFVIYLAKYSDDNDHHHPEQ